MAEGEHDLAEREALLAEAERIARMGSWTWDVATGRVRWSDELYRILGYARTHAPSAESFFARIHPEDLPRIRAQSERTAAGEPPGAASCRVLHPDGTVLDVELSGAAVQDSDGGLLRIVGTLVDVTESRRLRADLERVNSELRDAQRLAHLGSWRLGRPDGPLEWSDEVYDLLGWPRSEPPTLPRFFELVSPSEQRRLREALESAFRGEERTSLDLEVACRDGVTRSFEATMRSLRDEAGRVTGAWGTLLDITSRRALEQRVLRSQKLELVGQLAGGIAHDFNNLLTVITLTAEAVSRGTRHPSARDILAAAERARGLTHQLLAFGRGGVGRPECIDLGASSRSAAALLGRLLGDNIGLEVDVATEALPVSIDDTQYHQVLMNLLVNARDAMPGGGEITLVVRAATDGDLAASSPLAPAGGWVLVEVRDGGSGMDATTQARAFEPFFTTKPVGAGSGLGLATVQALVERARGMVRVTSEVGRGTTFRLFFPRADVTVVAPAAALVEVDADAARRGHIVLVEDEAMVASVVHGTLVRAGYSVATHRRPSDLLADGVVSAPFDLLITDLNMPEMSGVDLVRALRTRGVVPRVLFTTGYAPESILASVGDDAALLTKPFGADALLRTVDRLLATSPA